MTSYEMTDYDVEIAYLMSNERADEAAREAQAEMEAEMAWQEAMDEENHSEHYYAYCRVQAEKALKEHQRQTEIRLYGRAFS